MWGRDRKIRPEDHRLASRGLPSPDDHRLASRGLPSDDNWLLWGSSLGKPRDAKRWSSGWIFLSHSTFMMDSYNIIWIKKQTLPTVLMESVTIDTFPRSLGGIIRIHHECEGGIGISVPRIAIWHLEACWVMTNSDPQDGFFYPNPTLMIDSYNIILKKKKTDSFHWVNGKCNNPHVPKHKLRRYNKNSPWVCGLDRKIHPEDRRLASRGLLSDDKRWSRGTEFFYTTLTRIMDSLSCPSLYRILLSSWIHRDATWSDDVTWRPCALDPIPLLYSSGLGKITWVR